MDYDIGKVYVDDNFYKINVKLKGKRWYEKPKVRRVLNLLAKHFKKILDAQ